MLRCCDIGVMNSCTIHWIYSWLWATRCFMNLVFTLMFLLNLVTGQSAQRRLDDIGLWYGCNGRTIAPKMERDSDLPRPRACSRRTVLTCSNRQSIRTKALPSPECLVFTP